MPVEQVQGPSLALTADRLRPEWTRRWIAMPQRFMHYKTVMPQNFPANVKPNPYPESFVGSENNFSEEQIRAVRDFLMIYPQVADWPVLKYRSAAGGNWRSMMRSLLIGCFCLCLVVAPTQAADWGNVKGQIVFDGTPPTPKQLDVNKDQAQCLAKGPIMRRTGLSTRQ